MVISDVELNKILFYKFNQHSKNAKRFDKLI